MSRSTLFYSLLGCAVLIWRSTQCAIHNTSDLSIVSVVTNSALAGGNRGIALFTSGSSFYMGSFEETGIVAFRDQRAIMRLSQTYNLDESKHSQQVTTYDSKATGIYLTDS